MVVWKINAELFSNMISNKYFSIISENASLHEWMFYNAFWVLRKTNFSFQNIHLNIRIVKNVLKFSIQHESQLFVKRKQNYHVNVHTVDLKQYTDTLVTDACFHPESKEFRIHVCVTHIIRYTKLNFIYTAMCNISFGFFVINLLAFKATPTKINQP